MTKTINLCIILEKPPPNVVFGLQKGKGTGYQTIQKQTFVAQEMRFDLTVDIKSDADALPDFFGQCIHGVRNERFIYLNIGTSAGQLDSVWSRRLKIPLTGIKWAMIDETLAGTDLILETRVNGKGKDGSPNCGTVKPFGGWYVVEI